MESHLQNIHRIGMVVSLAAVLCASRAAPTDNPIATYYGPDTGHPVWTDEIAWANTIDMSSYTDGADDFERFENARDELYAQGGGVLFYPAGNYHFTVKTGPNGRGLMLKRGVVIRGEAPVSDKAALTARHDTPGLAELGTKFHFSFRDMGDGEVPWMWNCIGIMPDNGGMLRDVSDVGIAWVDIEGATVFMGVDADWDATWGESDNGADSFGAWNNRIPDGTHILDAEAGVQNNSPYTDPVLRYYGAGMRRFVFGCRFRNATVSNWGVDRYSGGRIDTGAFYYGGQRGTARIALFGSHLLIANNAVVKPTKCFYYEQLTRDRKQEDHASINTVLFDYGKCGGVMVNKDLFRGFDNRCNITDGMYYEKDVIVRDNWVYNHGNEGFALAGTWMVVRNNVNYRDYLDETGACYGLPGNYELTLSGFSESVPIDDNQSRAFDLAGMNVWIDNNWYTGTGSHPGNDGEGMLCQRIGAVEVFSWAFTHNSQGSTGENGYIAPYDVHVLGLLTAWNDQRGGVGIFKTVENRGEDIAVVDNGSSEVSGADGTNIQDFLSHCPSGSPAPPGAVTVEAQDGIHTVTWSDQADNEIGFRVDRSVGDGDWYTIAYRPRNESGAEWDYPGTEFNGTPIPGCQNQGTVDFNRQEWVDYTAPAGAGAVRYRVAAVNCNDDESGATVSDPIAVVAEPARRGPAGYGFEILRTGGGPLLRARGKAVLRISVHDLSGRPLRVPLVRENGFAHADLRNLAPGTYVARVGIEGRRSRAMVVPVCGR